MRNIFPFCFLAFVLGFSLHADPALRYTESMRWINRSEREVISAGGTKTGETISAEMTVAVYEFHNTNGKYTFVLTNNKVIGVLFENEKRASYKNEGEFNNDVERVITLAQSIGGYLHHDRTANDINHVHYRIDSFENTHVINMDVFSYLTNKSENNYGHYSLMITPVNDLSIFGIFRPPPPGVAPPPPGAR